MDHRRSERFSGAARVRIVISAWLQGLLLGVLLAGAACAKSAAADGAAVANRAARIDALMRAYQGAVPGASVLVLRDGLPVFRRTYGFANLEDRIAAAPATNYRLASMTKQFTAAAILLLAEDGRLTLNDPVRKWLPTLSARGASRDGTRFGRSSRSEKSAALRPTGYVADLARPAAARFWLKRALSS